MPKIIIDRLTLERAEAEAESDKLLAYSREKLGKRDIHSMYEIVDRLAALEAAAQGVVECLHGDEDLTRSQRDALQRLVEALEGNLI